jgi:hypothetical protein
MARLEQNAERYLTRALGTRSKVLLINPPVEERRYHWLKWNQPLDLLRLGTWLRRSHRAIDVRLYDFMLPDESGAVHKHKVKETWTGAIDDLQLWHFGRTLEEFSEVFRQWIHRDGWIPDVIIVTSLTSYWHRSITKLLVDVCNMLGRKHGKRTKKILYGNYPRCEPEHAEAQTIADVALVSGVDLSGCSPDFGLYTAAEKRLPAFFSLDINDPKVTEHLQYCVDVHGTFLKSRGLALSRRVPFTVAFFNDDLCSPLSHLADVAKFAAANPKLLAFEGIAGVIPSTLTVDRLEQLRVAGFRTLYVEHARTPGGGPDIAAYLPLFELLRHEQAQRSRGGETWLTGGVTGFVNIGLPDDDMDELVRSTLVMNSHLGAIILKPHGYSPLLDSASLTERRRRWREPRESSPQWFPYVGNGATLTRDDYDNLIRWQNVINRRVKGTTFDFLDGGTVARLVRETLVAESWKPQREMP